MWCDGICGNLHKLVISEVCKNEKCKNICDAICVGFVVDDIYYSMINRDIKR